MNPNMISYQTKKKIHASIYICLNTHEQISILIINILLLTNTLQHTEQRIMLLTFFKITQGRKYSNIVIYVSDEYTC